MDVSLAMFKADGSRRDFPLRKSRIVVGRINTCDLRIPLSSVSRQHCELYIKGGEVYVRDLGSSNGTFVNNRRINEAALRPGDAIGIGPVVFFFIMDGQPAELEPIRSVIDQSGGTGVSAAQGTLAPAGAPPGDTLTSANGDEESQASTLPDDQISFEEEHRQGREEDAPLPLLEDEPAQPKPEPRPQPQAKAPQAREPKAGDEDELLALGEDDELEELPVLGEDEGEDEVIDAEELDILDEEDLEELDLADEADELDVLADSADTLEIIDDEFNADDAQGNAPEDDPISALEALAMEQDEAPQETAADDEEQPQRRRRKSG